MKPVICERHQLPPGLPGRGRRRECCCWEVEFMQQHPRARPGGHLTVGEAFLSEAEYREARDGLPQGRLPVSLPLVFDDHEDEAAREKYLVRQFLNELVPGTRPFQARQPTGRWTWRTG